MEQTPGREDFKLAKTLVACEDFMITCEAANLVYLYA